MKLYYLLSYIIQKIINYQAKLGKRLSCKADIERWEAFIRKTFFGCKIYFWWEKDNDKGLLYNIKVVKEDGYVFRVTHQKSLYESRLEAKP